MLAKLFKLAPTLLTLTLAAWVIWPYLPVNDTGDPPSATKTASPDRKRSTQARTRKPANPFDGVFAKMQAEAQLTPGKKSVPRGKTSAQGPDGGQRVEDVTEVIDDMVLSATIISGKKRIAMIDGRIYEQGDTIRDDDNELTNMQLIRIEPRKVVIARGMKRLELAYSNDLKARKPPAEMVGSDVPGVDPDVNAAIANNMGAELGLLRSLLASPLGSSLMSLSGGSGLLPSIPDDAASQDRKSPRRRAGNGGNR